MSGSPVMSPASDMSPIPPKGTSAKTNIPQSSSRPQFSDLPEEFSSYPISKLAAPDDSTCHPVPIAAPRTSQEETHHPEVDRLLREWTTIYD